jgi:hypothetical protein
MNDLQRMVNHNVCGLAICFQRRRTQLTSSGVLLWCLGVPLILEHTFRLSRCHVGLNVEVCKDQRHGGNVDGHKSTKLLVAHLLFRQVPGMCHFGFALGSVDTRHVAVTASVPTLVRPVMHLTTRKQAHNQLHVDVLCSIYSQQATPLLTTSCRHDIYASQVQKVQNV